MIKPISFCLINNSLTWLNWYLLNRLDSDESWGEWKWQGNKTYFVARSRCKCYVFVWSLYGKIRSVWEVYLLFLVHGISKHIKLSYYYCFELNNCIWIIDLGWVGKIQSKLIIFKELQDVFIPTICRKINQSLSISQHDLKMIVVSYL